MEWKQVFDKYLVSLKVLCRYLTIPWFNLGNNIYCLPYKGNNLVSSRLGMANGEEVTRSGHARQVTN